MSESIHLKSISIRDLGGIPSFSTVLGAVNIVVGDHGTGKTTVLRCVQTVFEGGSDPSLVRMGADDGEITITFTNGYTATKVQRRDGYELKVRTPEGGLAKRPAELMKEWAPSLSFDPLGFLGAPQKDQVAFLLRTLPLNFTAAEVNAAVDEPIAVHEMTLQGLNEVRAGVYDKRADVNRESASLQHTIEDFKRSLPKEEGKDWGAEVRRLQADVAAKDTAIATAKAELELEGANAIADAATKLAEKRTVNEARLRALETQINTIKAEMAADDQGQVEFRGHVNAKVQETLATETATLTTEKGALMEQLGTAQANADADTKASGIREAIATRSEALKGHVSREMRFTAQIKGIDTLKTTKLKALPVEGLDIDIDDKGKAVILINGIPLDRLNQQKKIFVAVQLVAKAASKMPLMLCEVAELNKQALADLTAATEAAGMQVILARWDEDGPLTVVTSAQEAKV